MAPKLLGLGFFLVLALVGFGLLQGAQVSTDAAVPTLAVTITGDDALIGDLAAPAPTVSEFVVTNSGDVPGELVFSVDQARLPVLEAKETLWDESTATVRSGDESWSGTVREVLTGSFPLGNLAPNESTEVSVEVRGPQNPTHRIEFSFPVSVTADQLIE
ncbi:hypothetical protein [Microbacterium sp. KR10-403]|uniref:hypothetical protein n=1 Tax=Microbacterium sp. KR10-403 TaxID=3158581 RepID=UPI0032E44162